MKTRIVNPGERMLKNVCFENIDRCCKKPQLRNSDFATWFREFVKKHCSKPWTRSDKNHIKMR